MKTIFLMFFGIILLSQTFAMSYAHLDSSSGAEPYRVTVIVEHIEYNSDADYLEDFTSGADLVLGWRAQLSGHDDAVGVGTFARDNLDLDDGGIIPVDITIVDHFECTPLGDLRLYAWGVESDQDNTLDTNKIMQRVVQNGDLSTGPLEAQQDFEEADDEWIGFDQRNLRGTSAEGVTYDADVVLILDDDETIGVKMNVIRTSVEDTGQCEPSDSSHAQLIPDWFKTNAKWWNQGLISDAEIINALESLMIQNIIPLDEFIKTSAGIEHQAGVPKGGTFHIPSYQKDVFGFWSDGLVSDQEIVNSVGFLIGQGIIDSQKIRESRASFAESVGLEIESPPIEYRTGSEDITVTKMPGMTKYADITLKRGTISAINEAQQWNKLASEMLFKLKDGEEKIHRKNYENYLSLYSESKNPEYLNQMLEQKEKSENAKSDALIAVENYNKIKELSEIAQDEYSLQEQEIPLELDFEITDSITNESEYFSALEKIQEYAENAVRKTRDAVTQLKQQVDEEYPRTHPDFAWDPAYNHDYSLDSKKPLVELSDVQSLLARHYDDGNSTMKIKVPVLIEQLFDPSIINTHSMINHLDENPFD